MKNTYKVAVLSKNINNGDRSTWLPLYYSFKENAVYTSDGKGRMFVTNLINPNTETDIEEAVERWKRL